MTPEHEVRFLTESAGVPLPPAMVGIVRRGWLDGGRAEGGGEGRGGGGVLWTSFC